MDALFASLYGELHRLAARHVHGLPPGGSLGTTTLVHEAYLKLRDLDGDRFADRGRFLAYASRAMRSLVIDYARRRRTKKRGGEYHLLGADQTDLVADGPRDPAVEGLAAAMAEVDRLDPAAAQLVDLHVFCGLSLVEIAGLRGASERTLQRDWRKARLLLRHLIATAD
ncbi:MAG TPA: ECF-type sigma factor [Gemmatimonadales bacterium]|nr:ECF-type sigma factor [Gemmatimonadales bacterium]